jgi:hypothetical protein
MISPRVEEVTNYVNETIDAHRTLNLGRTLGSGSVTLPEPGMEYRGMFGHMTADSGPRDSAISPSHRRDMT